MRHFLLASTCCFALASAASAETQITTATTAPVRTSTINAGGADDIHITSTGTITLTGTGATAVTVDSANKVTNEGAIAIGNADNATGILANAGASGGMSVTGKITVDESYAATDTDNDGDIDGPFAVGTGRTAIRTAGAYSGDIVVSSAATIAVEGNDSYGIRLDGPLNGTLSHDGTMTVLGDRAIGIQAGTVNGNVRLAGAVTAQGVNAIGARFDGPISGTLTIQGTIIATGYRYTTLPTDTSKLDADDLLQGGSAVIVSDNVAGGIILAKPPTISTTDTDVDKDGILDANETTAAVTSYGAAPAMRIGSATKDIVIGAVPATGTGYGLIVDGAITGNGLYSGVTGTGLAIGGLGGRVDITGGMSVSGTITASAVNQSSTALYLGSGANVPVIQVLSGGAISANGAIANQNSVGILVDAGANVPNIKNGGTIGAIAGTVDGTAVAIRDLSGTLTLVENAGTISATGGNPGQNLAIDLRSNTTGATVRQTAVASTATAPSIVGDIWFGTGNVTSLFDIADGTVTGNTFFGTGADTLNLSGDAIYTGNVSFGTGGATMSLAGTSQFIGTADFGNSAGTLTVGAGTLFSGGLANSGSLAVAISGGNLNLTSPAQINSLAVTNSGVLTVTLTQAGNTTPILGVTGTASFDTGSKIALRVADINNAVGDHLVLRAGTLTGAANITSDTTLVPYLYKATLSTAGNDVNVSLARKSITELALNRSEAAGFDAIYAALGKNSDMAGAVLAISDQATFRSALQQMLPDHAGGTFQAVTQGSRTFAQMLQDPKGPFKDEGKWGYWIDQVAWGVEKPTGDTANYETSGWGIGGGAELKTGLGNFGGSVAFFWSRNRNTENANEVRANQYELAGYWRLKTGRLTANLRGSISFIDLDGSRTFDGMNGTEAVSLTARADHGARLYSGTGAISYEMLSEGGVLSFRPVVAFDYYHLKEKAYSETGGGDAFDLIVDARTSDEMAVTASAVVGLNSGGEDQWAGWSRFELEAGRREIVSGKMGNTVAQFAYGGDQFTLLPDERESGWVGRVRGVAGNSGFQIGGEVGAEQFDGNWAVSLRASLRVGL